MAIELERKRRLGFAFSLKSNNTDTTKKSKISHQFIEDQRTEKSTFSDVKHHAFSAQRRQVESFKTATYAIDLHRNLQEFAKSSLFTAFFLGVPGIGSKI